MKLITRIIILVIGDLLALGVLIHNYETSSSIVKQKRDQ